MKGKPLNKQFLRVLAASLPIAASALILAGITPRSAHAQATIDPERKYTFGDNQAVIHITTTYDGTGGTTGDLDNYAGAQATTVVSNGGTLPPAFDSYCVQLGTGIIRPNDVVNVSPMNSSFNLGKAAINPGVDYGGALAWLYTTYVGVAADQTEISAQKSAALQLALWEVEYNWNGTGLSGISTTLDSTDALSNPLNFYYVGDPTSLGPPVVVDPGVTNAIRADASVMLTAWNGQTLDNSASWFSNNPVASGQSLIGPVGTVSSPEPGALALAAGPFVFGLLRIARRRR